MREGERRRGDGGSAGVAALEKRGEDADEREEFARLGVGELEQVVRQEAGGAGEYDVSSWS